MKDGGSTTSLWIDTAHTDDVPDTQAPLPVEIDVCVVGAGIAGISIAFELARKGVKVLVLDDGPIGGGETGRTTAHLASGVDDRYYELESMFGEQGARTVAASHGAAIDWIEHVAQELGIDCDFQRVDGYLFGSDSEIDKEFEAARRAGLTVDIIPRAPLPFDSGKALRYAKQAEFHPLKFLRGLAAAAEARGAQIHTGVHVEGIEGGSPVVVHLADGRAIQCRSAVDATNGAFSSRVKMHLRQAAYRTYVLGFDIAPGTVPHGLYWDTEDPYHYIRVAKGTAPGREVLIVGGNDHRVGQGIPAESFDRLEEWTRGHFASVGQIVARWSGQVIEPADSLAFIGAHPSLEHVFLVTGDSGNGLTHGVIAGMLIPELIAGRRPSWADVYDPTRHRHAIGTLLKDVAQSSAPYTDWLRKSDVPSVEDIPRGEGAVIRRGLHLVATYRDDAGTLHECSAVCPHLKAVVRWNDVEKTWDCPAHGSRFDAKGRVCNGPSAADLAPIDGKEAPAYDGRRTAPMAAQPSGLADQAASKPAGPS